MTHPRRLLAPALAALGALAAAFVGVWALGPPPQATLVITATRAASAPPGAQAGRLTLHRRGAAPGEVIVLSRDLGRPQLKNPAPELAQLAQFAVFATDYDAVQVGSGAGVHWVAVNLAAIAHQVTPLMLVLEGDVVSAVYAGDDVSVGLQEVQGRFTPVPEVALSDQSGRPVNLARPPTDLAVVVPFNTNCHESCPLYTALLGQLELDLAHAGYRDRVTLYEVTVDPARDDAAQLRAYRTDTGADWTFVTGDAAAITTLWAGLGIAIDQEPVPGSQPPALEVVDHTAALLVVDRQGFVRRVLSGDPDLGVIPGSIADRLSPEGLRRSMSGAWRPADALSAVSGLLGGHPEVAAAGGQAAAITLPTLGGASAALPPGGPAVIDFWASFCGPCREELPLLFRDVGASKARLALVDESEPAGPGRAFLSSLNLGLDSASDPGHAAGDRYGVFALPTAVFMDASGRVVSSVVGQLSGPELEAHLRDIGG
ncbi:MAG: SCO family protein [Candidatus Dormibacteria bacterium]